MTMALCFNCGEIKFGALCECSKCDAGPTGDIRLDIAFTDHCLAVDTLEGFGRVIKEIHAHSAEKEPRFWAFIEYVSQNHPSILRVNLKSEMQSKVEEILGKCAMPTVNFPE